MTMILPPPGSRMWSTLAGPLSSAKNAGEEGKDFASILAGHRDPAADLLQAGGNEPGALPLSDRLAEVFNEFGFFRAPTGNERMTPDSSQQMKELPQQSAQQSQLEASQPEEASESQLVVEGDGGTTPPSATSGVPSPQLPDVSPTNDPIRGAISTLEAEASGSTDSAAHSHIIAQLPGSDEPGRGWEPPVIQELPLPRVALPLGPTRMEPPASPAASQNSDGAASQGADSDAQTDPVRAPFERRSDPNDRLIFQIGEHMVELIGRLEGLSDEEKKKLVDALTSVLQNHGLSLGSATLNGQSFFSGLVGGQG